MASQHLTRKQKQLRENGLASICAARAFPNRRELYPSEVAAVLRVTEQHIIDLVFEGELGAVDVTNRTRSLRTLRGKKVKRSNLRVPVHAYDAFIRGRCS